MTVSFNSIDTKTCSPILGRYFGRLSKNLEMLEPVRVPSSVTSVLIMKSYRLKSLPFLNPTNFRTREPKQSLKQK